MNSMVTFALILGILLLGQVHSQNTVGDQQVTIKAAQDIVTIAKTMQADIGSKGKSYVHMSEIVNKVAEIVSNTDVDSEKSKVRAVNGLTLAGGIVSGIGGALSAAGASFGS